MGAAASSAAAVPCRGNTRLVSWCSGPYGMLLHARFLLQGVIIVTCSVAGLSPSAACRLLSAAAAPVSGRSGWAPLSTATCVAKAREGSAPQNRPLPARPQQ